MSGGEQRPVSTGDREEALGNEILRTVCGSGVHGMAIPGTDDNDEMGVYIQSPEQVLGLTLTAGHYVSRTRPEGERSQPGDTDLTIYGLRKYMRLATQGNPTVLTVLYAPDDAILVRSDLGDELRALAPKIISANAGWRHLGYLDGQRERMTGEGKQGRVPNRPELIAMHGYDVKYASHALRLGYQGLEITATGRLTLPLSGRALEKTMEVKRGKVPFTEALRLVDELRDRLRIVMSGKKHDLPDAPDYPAITEWMIHAHQAHWLDRSTGGRDA